MERKLVAILHADVQGYSRLIGQDDTGTLQILTPYLAMMRECVHLHGGQAVGSRGDSLLATFPSTVAALQSAIAMQQEPKARNATLPSDRRVEFRMGLNAGEILVEGEEIHGDAINIAVRLEGLAEAGGICLSEIVYRQVKHRVAVGYADLGDWNAGSKESLLRTRSK
jgi:class 3 adenylate cyclase